MGTGGRHGSPLRIGVSWVEPDRRASDVLALAVQAAGGELLPLLTVATSWTAEIKTLRGLVLKGGNAVDPRRYGQVTEGPCRTVIPQRDELELEALEYCRGRGLPVLALCRGMQLLNVACGGSMLQALPITTAEHEAVGEASRFHSITLSAGTRLSELAGGQPQLRVNSRHYQGLRIEHVTPGLRVSALAPDGVVEGIEGRGLLEQGWCLAEDAWTRPR